MKLSRFKAFSDEQYNVFIRSYIFPLIAIAMFLGFWSISAQQVETSLGQLPGPQLPGPTAVFHQASNLVDEHYAEREKEVSFYERQHKRNAAKLEKDPEAEVKIRPYTGKATFFDQVLTSLFTVFTGFIMALLIAIPVGIITGLSNDLYRAINPIVQLLKPVSPLAWLPIVTMVVSAVYVSDDPVR
jgi:nitrate/nitrite transport system permease protein